MSASLRDKKEVAALLKCSVSKIEKMMRAGEITYEKIGSLVRFRPSDIAPFFEGATVSPGFVQAPNDTSRSPEKTIAYESVRGQK